MGILDRFTKSEPEGGSPPALPLLCYRIAYFALPRILFANPQRTIGYFTNTGYPAGAYLYAMGTQMLKVEPNREDALSFKTHMGELVPGTSYYILEYPVPPPVDLEKGLDKMVLAPFFSVILLEAATGEVAYYTLGQNPMQGTTLRTVTPDGTNANLGRGPAPELDALLEVLRGKARKTGS